MYYNIHICERWTQTVCKQLISTSHGSLYIFDLMDQNAMQFVVDAHQRHNKCEKISKFGLCASFFFNQMNVWWMQIWTHTKWKLCINIRNTSAIGQRTSTAILYLTNRSQLHSLHKFITSKWVFSLLVWSFAFCPLDHMPSFERIRSPPLPLYFYLCLKKNIKCATHWIIGTVIAFASLETHIQVFNFCRKHE